MKSRFDARRIAVWVFDAAVVGAFVGLFGLVWTLSLVWVQVILTGLLIAVLADFCIRRISLPPRGLTPARYVEPTRRDTISPPVGETDEAQDRWAGVSLDEAFDRAEAEEEEALRGQ